MKSAQIYQKVKTDKFYLLNSYLIDMILMIVLILGIVKFQINLDFSLSLGKLIIVLPIAIINGFFVASLLHNTSHGNVKTDLMNRVAGEYAGYWVLYGFTNFVLIHLLHHQFTDDELDPVNPKGMSFITFLSAPMRYMIKTTKLFLVKTHGHHSDYQKILKKQTIVFHFNLVLRLIVWYLILGKALFVSFYIPGFLTIIAVFAHINYACHRDHDDGSVEIVNLDHNLYYKIANFFTFGGYYHKNHHINVKLFNPQKLKSNRSKLALWSIPQNTNFKTNKNIKYSGSVIYKYLDINNVWGESSKNLNSLR